MKHFLDPNKVFNWVETSNCFPKENTHNLKKNIGKVLVFMTLLLGLNASAFAQCIPMPLPADQDSTRVLPTTCEMTDTFAGKTGNVWEFTIDNAKSYEFKVCASGITPSAELYNALDGSAPLSMSSTVDANGCVTVTYDADGVTCTSPDDLIYLAIYSHSCLKDWKDVTIEASCLCCSIECAEDVHVAASQSTCAAGSFTIPVPTLDGPCNNMVAYAIVPPLVPAPAPASPVDVSTVTELTVGAGVPVGMYTITWTATDCDGGTYVCEQNVIVEPIMVCNDNVNITLGAGCWVDITPDMILEAPCTVDSDYTVCVEGNAEGDPRITTPGEHKVTIKYTPATPNAFSGVSCWGYVTVEDKSGPTCDIPLAEQEEHISCGEEVPCAEPTFDDCAGVDNTNMTTVEYGVCGEIDGVTATEDGDFNLANNLPLVVNGVTIPAADATESAPFTGAGFVLDHVIGKTWQATDVNGFVSSSCVQWIYVWRPNVINDPLPSIELECGTDLGSCNLADADPQYVPNFANPKYDGAAFVPGATFTATPADADGDLALLPLCEASHMVCKYSVAVEDQPIGDELCGTTEKIIRKWTVLNWCTGAIVVGPDFTQVIKTVDTTAPEWSDCPDAGDLGHDADNPIVLNTSSGGPNQCFFIGNLNAPTATDECSDPITYSAVVNDANGNLVTSVNDLSAPVQLNMGMYAVQFFANDDCGKASEACTVWYQVMDDDKPVAICDEHTVISLTNVINGDAQICAQNLDSGSYDNCGIASMMIKRMGEDDSTFATCLTVNCGDAGTPVMVVLRVMDAAGNHNECMVEVEVQDKIGPFITCPAPVTINCTQDYTDLDITGRVMSDVTTAMNGNGFAFDNCVLDSVTYVDAPDLECGSGSVIRSWTAWSNGTSQSCDQIITINPNTEFIVAFPDDILLDGCPSDLGDTNEPVISGAICAQIAVSSEDQRFDVVDGACYKILRTWTVVNWCTYDHLADNTDSGIVVDAETNKFQDDGDGYFRYVQVIKVNDTSRPEFTNCPDGPLVVDITSTGCEGFLDVTLLAEDDCNNSNLEYSWEVNRADGTRDAMSVSNNVTGFFPIGTHSVTVFVNDGCGNNNSCTFDFEVRDRKAPTPVCKSLSTDLMNDGTGTVTLWANEFIEPSTFDNCASFDELTFFIEKSIGTNGVDVPFTDEVSFSCEDLALDANGNRVATNISVNVWVVDPSGNADFCTALVLVTDHVVPCPQVVTGSGSAEINGRIFDEMDQDVEQVMVELTSTSSTMTPFLTGPNGAYSFPGLTMNNNYVVEPEKDLNPLNGVTTYDLVLISQHIIGTMPISSPYKIIAADVNGDGNITTFDLVQLRQLILYVVTDFPTNKSWRFVDADFVFPVPTDPFATAFPEVVNVASVNTNYLADFIGIKIGDVNNSATPNTLLGTEDRNYNAISLSTESKDFLAGERVAVPIRARGIESLTGLQYTIGFDKDDLEFVDFDQAELADLGAANFGTNLLDEGVITTSWNTTSGEAQDLKGDLLYTLNFVAKQDGNLAEALNVSSRYTKAEAFNSEGVYDVNLIFDEIDGQTQLSAFELFQNAPNPFRNETSVSFYLPQATTATLRIMDVSGKELLTLTNDYSRGNNTVEINLEDLDVQGVLYYQLETSADIATKKMIIIE